MLESTAALRASNTRDYRVPIICFDTLHLGKMLSSQISWLFFCVLYLTFIDPELIDLAVYK